MSSLATNAQKPSLGEAEAKLPELTPKEKISLLSGIDFWHTQGIKRLEIPSLRLSDGPNGVRGTKFFDSIPSACLPCGTALGATWDVELINHAGNLIAEECRAKGAHVWLGPTVNIQRSPLGGRGFESYSEDPVLSGLLAAAIVRGVQAKGIASSIKHFVANDMDHQRTLVNCIVSDRALREIYLLPFQLSIRDSQPWSLMTAYNRLNGTHVNESRELLQNILREEWQWNGMVMSDWYGTFSTTEAMNAGMDLEMPGPSQWRGKLLASALGVAKVTSQTLDDRVRAMLRLVDRVKASGIPENAPEVAIQSDESAGLLRQISANSIVLLKNEQQTLPFQKDKSIAVIGPNAKVARYCGGGSAFLRPYRTVSIYEALEQVVPHLTYALGCNVYSSFPILGKLIRIEPGKEGMFTFSIYLESSLNQDRTPLDQFELDDTNIILYDYDNPKIEDSVLYASMEGELCPEESGEYIFGLSVAGKGKLYIDEQLIINNADIQTRGESFFGSGTVEESGALSLEGGKVYKIRVDFSSAATSELGKNGAPVFGAGGLRVGCARKTDDEEEIKRAVEIARKADQVILCCGLSGDFESEGFDRSSMDLPGRQDRLIQAVSEANPRCVVVLQSGNPVSTPWVDSVGAVVQAWYGGNESGHAVADVLLGTTCPSAKLPLSWPIRNEDNPAFLNFKSDDGRCLYGEDVYVGYRFYEKTKKNVQWPFGHGLSYATFSLHDLSVEAESPTGLAIDDILTVSVQIDNTCTTFDAAEVVQVYVSPPDDSGVSRPVKELKGFHKVIVKAMGTETIRISIPVKYATSYWSEARKAWSSNKGTYAILVGTSSSHTLLQTTFIKEESHVWNGL